MRSDMVQFTPPPKAFYKPQADTSIQEDIKANGCSMINEYLERSQKVTRCKSVDSADIIASADKGAYYEASFTSSENEDMKARIEYYFGSPGGKTKNKLVTRVWSAEENKPVQKMSQERADKIAEKLRVDGCQFINSYSENKNCSVITHVDYSPGAFNVSYDDKGGIGGGRAEIRYRGEKPDSITINNGEMINLNPTSLDRTEYHTTDPETVNSMINQLKTNGCEIINKKINECIKVLEVTHQSLKSADPEDAYRITYALRPVHIQQQPGMASPKQNEYTPTDSAILYYRNNTLYSIRMSGG